MLEVKEIYLDMDKVEKKWKTTFHIEDERFDKPLTLKIGYEDKDIQEIRDIKKSCGAMESNIEMLLTEVEWKEDKARELIEKYQEEIKLKDKVIKQLEKEVEQTDKRQDSLHTVLEEQNKAIKSLNGELIHLKEKLNEFEQKITKQPKVYHYKEFISWTDIFLKALDLNAGDYVKIKKVKIIEKNEHCENKCWTTYDIIHVPSEWYFEDYQLESTTPLDTPTATVEFTLTFIPC